MCIFVNAEMRVVFFLSHFASDMLNFNLLNVLHQHCFSASVLIFPEIYFNYAELCHLN